MAATKIISDNDNANTHISADGHANPMGNCASAGKKKVSKPSSSSSSATIPRPSPSTRRFQEMATQAISKSARSSSTGKDRRVPITHTSSQSMARSSSTGKDRHFLPVAAASTAMAAAASSHVPLSGTLNPSHTQHTASGGILKHGHSHHTASKGANTNPDSSKDVLNGIHPHHTALKGASINATPMQSQLLCHGESKLPSSLHKSNSTPLKPGANGGGSTPRKFTDAFHGTSTSKKSNNTSTKMGPDDSIRAVSSEEVARVTEISSKGRTSPSDTKGLASEKTPKDLCKNCKGSILESVCFIANDGRIAAVSTGAASICHFHHCNSRRCAANPNYHPSPSVLTKKVLVSMKTRSPLSQTARTKSSTLSRLGDRSSVCSSTNSSLYGDDWDAQKGGQESEQSGIDQNTSVKRWSEDEQSLLADTDKDSGCGVSVADQNGFENCGSSPSGDDPSSVLMQGTEEHDLKGSGYADTDKDSGCGISVADQNGFENCGSSPSGDDPSSVLMQGTEEHNCKGSGYVETGTCCSTHTAAPHTLSDAHDDEKSCVSRDECEELNGSKSFFYHGDNEYSCSDDSTEVATTPKSSLKNALEDLSNTDFEQSSATKSLQARRSSMARLRRKYLNSLKEQEAETVRLRKQEIQARKQAGDWMLDCAMEEILQRLAPDGEARVKVLVEAFETIMQHSDSEGSQTHHQDHALQQHDNLDDSSVSMHC